MISELAHKVEYQRVHPKSGHLRQNKINSERVGLLKTGKTATQAINRISILPSKKDPKFEK